MCIFRVLCVGTQAWICSLLCVGRQVWRFSLFCVGTQYVIYSAKLLVPPQAVGSPV